MKYLLLVVGLVIAYWIFRAYRAARQRSSSTRTRAAEDMVRCAQCGLHLPRSESLMSGQAFYCTPEHRRLHQERD